MPTQGTTLFDLTLVQQSVITSRRARGRGHMTRNEHWCASGTEIKVRAGMPKVSPRKAQLRPFFWCVCFSWLCALWAGSRPLEREQITASPSAHAFGLSSPTTMLRFAVRRITAATSRQTTRTRSAATASFARQENVYHDEHPMASEWRRRDALKNLRDTHDADGIVELANSILESSSGPLRPQEATLLISKFGKAGDVARATEVFGLGREEDASAAEEVRVRSALMHAHIRNGQYDKARDLFKELESNVAFPIDSVVVDAAATAAKHLNDSDLLDRAAKALAADANLVAPLSFHVARVALASANGSPEDGEAVIDEVIALEASEGQKLKPADATKLFQELVEAYDAAGNYAGVLRSAERLVDAAQRPNEPVVSLCIKAAGALGDNADSNEQLLRVFSSFRAGPRIQPAIYEQLMEVLGSHENYSGVVTVFDEVSSQRRPTQAMVEMLQQALRHLPRSQALEHCATFGIAFDQ